MSSRSEISVEEETSQSGNEEFSVTDNDPIAAVIIEEDLNYSIKRYCNYTCTPEHSTHDQAIEDIHSADDTSARTPRSYSSMSEEGKRAAATFLGTEMLTSFLFIHHRHLLKVFFGFP